MLDRRASGKSDFQNLLDELLAHVAGEVDQTEVSALLHDEHQLDYDFAAAAGEEHFVALAAPKLVAGRIAAGQLHGQAMQADGFIGIGVGGHADRLELREHLLHLLVAFDGGQLQEAFHHEGTDGGAGERSALRIQSHVARSEVLLVLCP